MNGGLERFIFYSLKIESPQHKIDENFTITSLKKHMSSATTSVGDSWSKIKCHCVTTLKSGPSLERKYNSNNSLDLRVFLYV